MTISFRDRVAIVTGAGGGLGRQYAVDLARLGARVVVNDVGGSMAATESSKAPADAVVKEIVDAGGEAIADYSDIRDQDAPTRIVRAAMDAWGRADVLINNAGIPASGSPGHVGETAATDFDTVVDINLHGAVGMCRAAFPVMIDQGYGRIVNVTSHSIFGAPFTAPYVVSRTGHLGLTTALAADGADHNIKANAVMPAAFTRMTAQIPDPDFLHLLQSHFGTETVSPAVLLLASEQVPVSGEFFHAGGGMVARVAFAVSQGATGIDGPDALLERFDEAIDMSDPAYPESVEGVMSHVFGRVLDLTGSAPGLGSQAGH